MLLRILIMFFLTIQASFGVSIVLDGTKDIISGSDCSTATYRFGTTTSYNGDNLDILLYVTAEDNEYTGGSCVDTQDGVVSFHIRDRDYYNDVASMDLQFIVVKHNTFTPVNVDTLTVTNFDLDSNGNSDYTLTDDVYYKNPLQTLISNDSEVLNISGDFYDEYTVKLRGKNNGNCNDSATLTELSCRAGAIWKNSSIIYARVQNDNAYGSYNWRSGYHRLLQFSFEYKDIAPLISENNTSKDCGTYSFSTNSNSWVEGTTHSQYDNNLNIQKNISIPNASQLKISFSGETEEDYDYLYIIEENGIEHEYSGNLNNLNNLNDLIIDGSSATLKFTSDGSVVHEGVTVTVESLGCGEESNPIGCRQTAWMFQNKPTDINALNLVNGQMSSVKNNISDDNINALGFNKKDGYFWGYNHTKRDGTVSRIGMNNQGDWVAEDFVVSGLSGFDSYVGDIDNNGHLYLKVKGSGRRVVVIDLDPNSPNYLTKINDFNLNFNLDTADWGFNPKDNKLYAVNNGSGTKYLYKIDPSNGHKLSKEDTLLTERRGFGASFFDANGFYYVYDNRSGNIYRIDVTNSPNAVLFATADIVSLNDGAMCTDAEFKFDFGDLPENYPTKLESNGARHSLPTYGEPTVYLGVGISHENNGKPSTDANLDENDDGVKVADSSLQNKTINSGETTTLQITTHGVGYLSAWIDWNSDGDFNDTNEQIAQNIDGSSGLITLDVVAPNNLSNSVTYARFRYSYQEDLTPIGSAIDGEVEDYKINIEAEPIPIANYHFDKCSWNGTAGEVKDSIGSINGTAHNNLTTNSDGKIQRAGVFNKSEEHYIDLGDNFNQNSDKFSVSIWFKSNTTDGEQILYNKEGLYEAAIQDGYFRYAFQPHWDWDGGTSFPVEPNTWYHAVITYDGTKQRVYRNGVEVYNREETGGNIGSSSFNLLVGARNSNTPYNFFDGTIDEFKIYNGTLSAKDINLTYQNEKIGKNWDGTDREAVVCEETQKPFTCNETLYLSNRTELGTGSGDNGATWLHSFNSMGTNYAPIGSGFISNDGGYNAIGYNVQDNFIYALYDNHLLKIGNNAGVKDLGVVQGLPSEQLYAGEFDRDGFYYVSGDGSATNKMYKIDITQKKVIKTITLSQSVRFWDMAIDTTGEYFYTMLIQGANGDFQNDKFAKIKISDGIITTIGDSHSDLPSYISLIFTDAEGKIIALSQDGKLYEITQSGKVYFTRPFAPLSFYNDGTSCPDANITLPPHPPRLSINNVSQLEGDSGETTFNFTVTADKPFDMMPMSGAMFYYRVVDGDGEEVVPPHEIALSSDHDFKAQEGIGMGMNMFGNGVSINLPVTVYGDKKVESDEEFYVEIYSPQLPPMMSPTFIIDKNVGVGTIINDDAPKLSIERINSNTLSNDTEEKRKSFYTQVTGKDFDYAIVSYVGNNPYPIEDTTVKVELIDNNSTTANEVIYGAIYLHLSDENTRFNITKLHDLEIQRATRDAIFKISYLVDENGTLMHGTYNNEFDYNLSKSSNKNRETYGYSDNFAIRPAGFKKMLWADDGTVRDHLATSNQKESYGIALAAGYEYELQVKALDDKGEIVESYKPQTTLYQEVNATLVFDGNKTKCADTSDKKLNYYNFTGGINSNKSFSNSNVGNYYISVKDENWTNIDHFNQGCIINSTSNEADDDGRFGCNIGSTFDIHSVDPTYNHYYDLKVYFQPYMFDVNLSVKNSSNNGKDYLYMSNLFDSNKMSIVVDGNVTALAKSGEVTTNFTEGCLAHKVDLSLDYRVTTDSGVYDNNLTQLQTTKNTPVIIQQQIKHNDGAFSNIVESNTLDNNVTLAIEDFDDNLTGSTYFKLLYNIRKNLSETTNPIQIDFRQANVISEDSGSNLATNELEEFFPEGKANLNSSVKTFYYARVASLMESFPETNKKVIKTPLYVEIYCKVLGNRDWCDNTMNLQNIGRNTYKTDKGWYLAVDHNSAVEGKINNLISSNNTIVVNNANPVADFIDGRIDNIETEYANETLAGIHKAEIAIDSDSWLRFNTKETVAGVSGHPSSYSVTFKSISNETGVGQRGYMLKQRPQVDRNGKMSW